MVATEKYDYTFFGVPCTYVQFAEYMEKKNHGQCPFCHRTGLKKQYGSDRKHIGKCAKLLMMGERGH